MLYNQNGTASLLIEKALQIIDLQGFLFKIYRLAYQLTDLRRIGMVMQRAPPPPRGSSDPSRVITYLS